MSRAIQNVLSSDQIDYLMALPEVVAAKQRIDSQTTGYVSFTVHLTPTIKSAVREYLGLDLTAVDTIPMRWIKGDTAPHVDTGRDLFDETHLVYLTDATGELIVDGAPYPIARGCGYVFSEGLCHETVGTGSVPRLLLGPMSEVGTAVGLITFTYYIRQTGGVIEYSTDLTSWSTASWPFSVSGGSRVVFTTDITITSSDQYFVCNGGNIVFGSTTLQSSGTRPKITIDGVIGYPGFIQNGTASINGNSNIYIYNLEIVTVNNSTLAVGGGWVCQAYFGKGPNNYIFIVNCSSSGPIGIKCGGIVGEYANAVSVIGCSSSGDIDRDAGGIVGAFAAIDSGSLFCDKCWSTGIISSAAGGIFGQNAGANNGTAGANRCYSINSVGTFAGGIFGRNAGIAGNATASACYSRGLIDTDGGGIYGIGAGSSAGYSNAYLCYSAGIVTTSGCGIYGSGKVNGSADSCYVANGMWSNTAANMSLSTGIPSPNVGFFWAATGINQPYELTQMGYSPYTLENIVIPGVIPSLVETYDLTVAKGDASTPAIKSGLSYTILDIAGTAPILYTMITINEVTGAISVAPLTPSGTYTITVRNTGSYNITQVNLTVIPAPIPINPCCANPVQLKGLDYTRRCDLIAGRTIVIEPPKYPMSYDDIMRIKKANASRR